MTKHVLILCTGNSCRSQMAEGLWQTLGQGEWQAESAGSRPSGYVHPLAVQAMQRRGIDISSGRSKSVEEFAEKKFDLVITVCDNARESCPVYPHARETLHWPFEDPAEARGSEAEQLPVFERIRDEIETRIARYLAELSNEGLEA